jgi:hypothetical protein
MVWKTITVSVIINVETDGLVLMLYAIRTAHLVVSEMMAYTVENQVLMVGVEAIQYGIGIDATMITIKDVNSKELFTILNASRTTMLRVVAFAHQTVLVGGKILVSLARNLFMVEELV